MLYKSTLLVSVLCFLQFASAQTPQCAPPESADMRCLFNGKDLTGWEGDARLWSVKEGVIHGETTLEKATHRNTFLIWKDGAPRDFELRLAFRCSTANNSGIQYRSTPIATNPAETNQWRLCGYQHEIRNSLDLPNVAGFIYDEGGKRKRICLAGEKVVWSAEAKKQVVGTLIDAQSFRELFKLDQWNEVIIIARGNNIKHYLNNRLIVDFTDADPQLALYEGLLGLQLHAGVPMWAEYKNIRLKELK